MRGQRKPTVLKLLHGEKNKDRMNPNEPKPRPISPEPPQDMDLMTSKVWVRLAGMLNRNGLLTEADGDSFAALCRLEAMHVRVRGALSAMNDVVTVDSNVVVDKNGVVHKESKINPLLNQEMKIIALKRQLYAQFGMTPASRTKITVPGGLNPGDFEGLLD